LDAGAAKGALFATLKIGTGTLLVCFDFACNRNKVFNCHLQASHSYGKYSHIRADQLKQLRRFITEKMHYHKGVPWLLAGDFNIGRLHKAVA
jgi:hypothetical protein